jgi:hypothetical protein
LGIKIGLTLIPLKIMIPKPDIIRRKAAILRLNITAIRRVTENEVEKGIC